MTTAPAAVSARSADSTAAAPGNDPWKATLNIFCLDITVPLCTFAASLAGLAFVAIGPFTDPPSVAILVLTTLVVPLVFLLIRLWRGGELTIPLLLVVTSLACGPIGALGCGYLAGRLRRHRPAPRRLRSWYEYIAGIVARDRMMQLYDDLSSGRLPHDPAAEVPRFRLIMHDASTDEQQRVLGVLGRRYHCDFRPALRDALRNRNSFIRAQAAAVASQLDVEEKSRLSSSTAPTDAAGAA